MKVLVLMGGISTEREVSLKSGRAVAGALKSCGYDVIEIDFDPTKLEEIINNHPDVVYIALHGKYGEDGTLQGFLDLLNIPYTGSGTLTSALCMNKILTKKMLVYEGLPTPEFIMLNNKYFNSASLVVQSLVDNLGLPLVIKPASQGSSIGTFIVKSADKIVESIEEAFKFDEEILIERFINGKQLTVTVLGNDNPLVLPVIEITAENDFYNYESKYTPGMSHHIIPARIDDKVTAIVQKISREAYIAIGCRGYSRIDVMLDDSNSPYILEINTIPGMTATSLVPDAARAAGISFEQLVDRIVKLALK